MADPLGIDEAPRLTSVQWLICFVAAMGFAFDIYELLMLPLILRPALLELGGITPGSDRFFTWIGIMFYAPAFAGGIFGLLGGYLTDRLGRRRVLTWSILLYAISAFLAGYSTSLWMLLFFRCTTFIGVCVEFVAAVAWLAELFPNAHQREKVLGYTQAFSSIGGLLVATMNGLAISLVASGKLPHINIPDFLRPGPSHGADPAWRYTLMSGLIPAIPLIFIRPFLPESPAWQQKKRAGMLRRPSLGALFSPELKRTTIVTTIMFACSYGAAFGAIQQMPQIVPGLPQVRAQTAGKKPPEAKLIEQKVASDVTKVQEVGGLQGRFLLALMAAFLFSRRRPLMQLFLVSEMVVIVVKGLLSIGHTGGTGFLYMDFWKFLLWGQIFVLGMLILGVIIFLGLGKFLHSFRNIIRFFQCPGLFIMPLVFCFFAVKDLNLLYVGMFFAGLLTVAQFSFWGNYLPKVYPVHLRGTGESFAANIGGRMIGTSFAAVTAGIAALFSPKGTPPVEAAHIMAYTAGGVALFVYVVGFATSFFLPEPALKQDEE